jgi:NAD(P)-dependent dehydrogenase (short-subunit alcohol dehydrogenase family)
MAVLMGTLLFSNVPSQLGLYRWLASHYSSRMGSTPAFHYGIPWKYTFQELYHTSNLEYLRGQTAIVTGANAGLGYEISLALARLGVAVTMACRNPVKCEAAAEQIRADDEFRGNVSTLTMDTASLSSVQAFAQAYMNKAITSANKSPALDMLFLNAGTVFTNQEYECVPLSQDGIEIVFATNYIGHHLLYRLLEPLLQASKLARVVQTSSAASYFPYSYRVATDLETLNGCSEPFTTSASGVPNRSYGQSKLAQILWSKAVTKSLGPDSNIYVNAFHPGVVNTEIWDKSLTQAGASDRIRRVFAWLQTQVMWKPSEGALTGLFLGVQVNRLVADNIRGKYYHPQAQKATNELANDVKLQDDLLEFSDFLVKDFVVDLKDRRHGSMTTQ